MFTFLWEMERAAVGATPQRHQHFALARRRRGVGSAPPSQSVIVQQACPYFFPRRTAKTGACWGASPRATLAQAEVGVPTQPAPCRRRLIVRTLFQDNASACGWERAFLYLWAIYSIAKLLVLNGAAHIFLFFCDLELWCMSFLLIWSVKRAAISSVEMD